MIDPSLTVDGDSFNGHLQDVELLIESAGLLFEPHAVTSIEMGDSSLFIQRGEHQWRIGSSLFGHQNCENHEVYIDFEPCEQSRVDAAALECAYIAVGVYSAKTTFDWVLAGDGASLAKVEASDLDIRQQWQYLGYVVGLIVHQFAFDDAVLIARSLLDVSRGTWPISYAQFARIHEPTKQISTGKAVSDSQPTRSFPKLIHQDIGLYPVVESVEWVKKLLELGVKTLQLRIKDPAAPHLEDSIKDAIDEAKRYGAQLFINDYWELACKYNAYGVHLGQEDLLTADLVLMQKKQVRLGLSTHGYYELLRAASLSPSYIALGHIFPTTTKQMPSLPQGLNRLKRYQELVNTLPTAQRLEVGYPTVAIGGINLENASKVLKCGVTTVAVVRAVTESLDLSKTLDQFGQLLERPCGDCDANG
ncbi:thiamine phosphate synthase [Vibrio sp. qd031]|uniref:thiamine phosphate synthase n=1 Tax=Vibrio sp. qd031 TaxID=1603038 RepID=UPI000A104005|nr:thiamine phosphate synthase [Vibrio sp. qd031]